MITECFESNGTLCHDTIALLYGALVSSLSYSYVWGSIADRKGRKPVIIVSVVLVGLTSAIFGFSVSYEMAIITRFLVGLTNGEL